MVRQINGLESMVTGERKTGTRRLRVSAVATCALTVFWGGCYDEQALIDARQATATKARLEEVDLGRFRVTMPRPSSELERDEVIFHVFGRVANRDLPIVQQLLAKNRPELNHGLLLSIRQMGMDEIADPALEELRETIKKSFNEMVEGDPIQSVGFYEFGYSNY